MIGKISTVIAAASCLTSAVAERPNILVILTDDQGYGQLDFGQGDFAPGYLGGKPGTARYKCDPAKAIEAAKQAMPNINALAKNGVRFTHGYVASPVCGPSRAAFLTSRYPARFGVYDNSDIHNGVSPRELFLAEKFQKSGYRTAMIGKWHVGKSNGQRIANHRDYHKNVRHTCINEHHPLKRGFDYYYGFNSSGAAYYNSPDIFRNFKNVDAPGYLTDRFTDEAVNFINQSGDKPFFIYLAYNAPHIPLEQRVPEKYQRFKTGNPEVDNYYAALAAVDSGVGRIITKLKKMRKLDNTLIFYFSDNGAVIDSPEPANGNFKGFKGLTFQGGVRVPMLASWPDGLPKGFTYNKNVSSMDILPSCLAAAGIQLPDNLDGVNLLPYLKGKDKGVPHQYLFWAGPRLYHWSDKNINFWRQYYQWITNKSDQKARKEDTSKAASWTVLSGNWLLQAEPGKNKVELFNIANDPAENNNVLMHNLKIANRLEMAYVQWSKDQKPPMKWTMKEWCTLKSEHVHTQAISHDR